MRSAQGDRVANMRQPQDSQIRISDKSEDRTDKSFDERLQTGCNEAEE
jgi:hypothetical protein